MGGYELLGRGLRTLSGFSDHCISQVDRVFVALQRPGSMTCHDSRLQNAADMNAAATRTDPKGTFIRYNNYVYAAHELKASAAGVEREEKIERPSKNRDPQQRLTNRGTACVDFNGNFLPQSCLCTVNLKCRKKGVAIRRAETMQQGQSQVGQVVLGRSFTNRCHSVTL